MSLRRSLIWTYGSQLATFVITFGTSVVVARLLTPRDMGVFAMAMAVSGLISSFTSFGVFNYVIREKEISRETLRASHTVNAGVSLFLILLILGISAIPGLFEDDVRTVLRLMSITSIFGAIEFTPWSLTMREGRFGLYAAISTFRNIVSALSTVFFAFAGFSAASFALGILVGYAASTLTYIVKRPRDVMILPTSQGLRPIVTFGLQMMSITGVAQLASRLSDLLLGKFLGLAALGLYARASSVANQINSNIYGSAVNVLFSKMSDELRTTGALRHVYLRAIAILTAILWPLLIGIAILARPFIAHLYGEKWLAAALPLSLLMIAQFVTLGFGMSWELFVLRKETARQTRFEFIRAIVGTAAFAAGAAFNISAAAAGRVVEAVFGYALYRPHMNRLAGAGQGELERVYVQSGLLTIAAVTPSLMLMLFTDWSPTASLPALAGAVLLGIAMWFGAIAALRHPLFEEASRILSHIGSVGSIVRR